MKNKRLIVATIVFVLLGYAFYRRDQAPMFLESADGTHAVDGDTLKIVERGVTKTVRLLGINTPETVDPRKPVQCYGKEASAKMHRLIDGQPFTLEAAPGREDHDIYGRLLRYVRLADGTDANLLMIREGYAYEYTVGRLHPRTTAYRAAEAEAKKAKRGLWSPATCNGKR